MVNPNLITSGMNGPHDLVGHINKRLQQSKIDDRIIKVVQQAISDELNANKIVLSSKEKDRLLDQITETIMKRILTGRTQGKLRD